MSEQVAVTDLNKPGNQSNSAALDTYPDACPVCHHAIESVWVHGILQERSKSVEAAFRCPRRRCQSVFIGYYEHRSGGAGSMYYLQRIAPSRPQERTFDETIKEISPAFVEIYNQAARAEQLDLQEVAGVGYRKALEFLVKDYLVRTYSDEEDEIRKKFLDRCIEDHIEDDALRNCAKLAAWLGNDETHYERRWDKDIGDLKQLIDLTVYSIAAARKREAYERDMLTSEEEES